MAGVVVLFFRLLLVLALYTFLFFALFSLGRQFFSKEKTDNKNTSTLTLLPSSGKSPACKFEQNHEINIGRSSGSDVRITSRMVSVEHAKIEYHHKQWWLSDLNSTNGTFLNGLKIIEPTVIISGDVIRIGEQKWKVKIAS